LGSHINHQISRCTKKNHEISQNKSWSSFDRRTTAWLTDGLSLLRDVQETLSNILHLPQSHESLRNRPVFLENLLEDLLCFVDAYGIFHPSVLSLREHQSAAQVALRRKDDVKISSYVKSRRARRREADVIYTRAEDEIQPLPRGRFGRVVLR
ncbi:unnamed protein product, partial [Brassica oleracea]